MPNFANTIEEETARIYGLKAVGDGVLNPVLYRQAPFKIMWVLKEPWFDAAWTMLKEEGIYGRVTGSPTLQPMAYVTYSVFNGFPRWSQMDYIRDNPTMAEVLRVIAYINVKKTSGGATSDSDEIYSWFKRGENVIKRQIAEYAPDIVVGCPPFMGDIFAWYPARSKPMTHGSLAYVADAGQTLLIEARHPAQRGIRETYVNELIEVIQHNGDKLQPAF